MRILVAYPRFRVFGGAELVVVRFCQFLARENVEHALLTTHMIPEVRAQIPDTRLFLRSFPPRGRSFFEFVLFYLRELKRAAVSFDVINAHNFPSELISLISPKPVVWMCNEPEPFIYAQQNPWKPFTYVWCFLEFLAARFFVKASIVADGINEARFLRLFHSAPQVAQYGIDWEYFGCRERVEFPWENEIAGKFVVLHVGWIQPLKNQLESLRTLKQIRSEIPNAILVLAGVWEENYKRELDSFISQNDLQGSVLFLGHLARAMIREWFYRSHVLLHPVKSQGGWLAPFEAISAGLPVIVSPELTCGEILRREGIGIVTTQFSQAVKDVARHGGAFYGAGSIGIEWVKKNLGWDSFSERLREILSRFSR